MNEVLTTIGFDLRYFVFYVLNFVVVAYLLYKFVFKKIYQIIEERQQIIQRGIDDQKRYEALLNETKLRSEEILAQAKQEANEIVEKYKQDAKSISDKIVADARLQSDTMINQGKALAQKVYEEEIKKVRKDAVDIVMMVTKELAKDVDMDDENKKKKAKKLLEKDNK